MGEMGVAELRDEVRRLRYDGELLRMRGAIEGREMLQQSLRSLEGAADGEADGAADGSLEGAAVQGQTFRTTHECTRSIADTVSYSKHSKLYPSGIAYSIVHLN